MSKAQAGVASITKTETTESGNKIEHPMTQEVVVTPKAVVVPCNVGVNARQTIPIGSYANIQVGVHLSVTVEPEEIEDAFDSVSEWVSEKLGQMVDEVTKVYGG